MAREAANIVITFLVSGLWHGASWNYVLWGAYHGALLLLGRIARGHPFQGCRSLRQLAGKQCRDGCVRCKSPACSC